MRHQQPPRRKRLCYRDGLPVRPIPRRSNIVYAAGKDVAHPRGKTELETHVPRIAPKDYTTRRLAESWYSIPVIDRKSDCAYYYDHLDELDLVWDGSRTRSMVSKRRILRIPDVRIDFDEGIFERAVPLRPAGREKLEEIDPLCEDVDREPVCLWATVSE